MRRGKKSREYGSEGILREILSYKTGIISVCILSFLVLLSLYTLVTIPYSEAVRLWRGSEDMWIKNPRNAPPEWIEIFYGKKLPRTILLSSTEDEDVVKVTTPNKIQITYGFNYEYDDFPSEIIIFFNASYNVLPSVNITWVKPDGESFLLYDAYMLRSPNDKLYLSNDLDLETELTKILIQKYGSFDFSLTIERLLFMSYDNRKTPTVIKGPYQLILEVDHSSSSDDLDAEIVIYGRVYGLAGTDHLRRPIIIAIMWGTPVALAFGLAASLMITLTQIIIATISGWYGGKVDSLLQRVTEVYMILPFLPILMMVSILYSIDLLTLLIVIVVLSVFGPGVKSTRVMVMQIKSYPYVEAARVYGASNMRIIFLYIIPKILPTVIPSLISSVPEFVFLEAALSFLGLGDPRIPTWGKIINDAFSNGALYKGYYYWVLVPSFMLILTALAFSFLGFTLDKIVNPRLKEQ